MFFSCFDSWRASQLSVAIRRMSAHRLSLGSITLPFAAQLSHPGATHALDRPKHQSMPSFFTQTPEVRYAYWPALAVCCGLIFLPSLLYLTRGGGARLRRPSRERTLDGHQHRLSRLLQWPAMSKRTAQSCRGWRRKRSTAASGTSWARHTRRRQKRPRCHLSKGPHISTTFSRRLSSISRCIALLSSFQPLSSGCGFLNPFQCLSRAVPSPY